MRKTSLAAVLFAATAFVTPTPSRDRPIRRLPTSSSQPPGRHRRRQACREERFVKDVQAFGKQMATDHTAVNKEATALVTKLKVKPEANDTSASLKKGGDENIAKLNKLKGKEFDKAYVDNEVTYHQAVLDAVDKTLIPSAKNAELKALIEKVRPAFVQHLEHAKHLQAELAK